MKFSEERKKSIIEYILTKIDEGADGISHIAAETFGISQSTVHVYLNELKDKGIIKKGSRDKYFLVSEKYTYELSREKGELKSEDAIFDAYIAPVIKDCPENVKTIWIYAFTEMVNNVIDHSQAEKLFIEIEKNYLKTEVNILDDGIGAFKKIQNHFGYPTLEDAVIELAKGKLTTDNVHHSGEGIFFTSRVMDTFILCSDHKIFSFNKYSEQMLADIKNETEFGTWVCLALSNSSQKRLFDIFNEYSDVDNGFTKTRIPLKNIFETAPVSRSQAKRIGSRLEQFKEVEIDFDGIEYLGQGFAHEMFFVFAYAHPEIKLTPLNMNKTVETMYLHTKAK